MLQRSKEKVESSVAVRLFGSMSSSSRASRAQPEPVKDWEDEYRRLRQQHNELKVLCNEQEEHIRK